MTCQTTVLEDARPTLARPSLASLIDRTVLLRAGVAALVLGTVLTLVNQGGAVFGTASFELLPFALVYVTPFVVVTVSQTLGIRRARLEAAQDVGSAVPPEPFWSAALAHGIPLRAVSLGAGVGAVNTAIVATAALMAGGTLGDLAGAPIAQAFVLPVLFGLLSQTLSFRRRGGGHRNALNVRLHIICR